MQASTDTLICNTKNGVFQTIKFKIFYFIKKNPNCTITDIKNFTKTKHQTATGQLSKLIDLGLVEVCGKITEPQKALSTFIIIDGEENQEIARKKRKEEKFIILLKNLVKNYDEFLTDETKETFNLKIN